jgi:DNA-binding winged helix-turn-helix (wHTH) protein
VEGEFRVAEWLVQPLLDTINGPEGTAIRVEPKVMDVLVYLAHHPDEVLVKERIIQAVWHGTFVTDDVLTGAISDLRRAFRDGVRGSRYIQTIPKRGYRLIAPVSFLQAPAAPHSKTGKPSRSTPVFALLAVAAVTVLLSYLFLRPANPGADTQPLYAFIKIAPGHELNILWHPMRRAMAFDQNESFVLYSAVPLGSMEADKARLFLHRIHVPDISPIPGTEGASMPFLSPDSSWVGFWADGKLKKTRIGGEASEPLCETPLPLEATWGEDGTIVFALESDTGLFRVPAGGGGVEKLTQPDRIAGESRHLSPVWLPGRQYLLFTIKHYARGPGSQVAVLDMQSRTWRPIIDNASDARYATPGQLVFLRGDRLYTAGFNLKALKIDGDPAAVEGSLGQPFSSTTVSTDWGVAQFCISRSGALTYAPGDSQPVTEIVFVHNWFAGLKTVAAHGKK